MPNFKYMSAATGKQADGDISLDDYRVAKDAGMTLSSLLAAKYPDADPKFGSVFDQGCQSVGIHIHSDPSRGIQASSVADMLSGAVTSKMSGGFVGQGTIVSPSTQGTTPASRLFFPETVLSVMTEKLVENQDPESQIWDRMIGVKDTIQTEMFTRPMIDVTAPRSERSIPTSQNTLPRSMVSITSSQYSKSVETVSIGLQIAEQAQRNSSIDLVTTIMAQQAQGERYARLWEDINEVVTGNIDAGQAALTPVLASSYDAAATGGVMTQKAWLKALYDETRKVSYDSAICDIDAFLAIQNRQGRPQMFDPRTTGVNSGEAGMYGLNVEPNLLNFSLGVPNVMLVPTGVVAAGHVLLFDSRYALARVDNTSATYSATESMVLQRSNVFRVDYGSLTYRLMDEAFQYLDFS